LTVSKSTTSASVVEKVPKNKKEVMPRNAAATSTVSAFSGALSSSELPIDETALTVYTQSDALTPQQTRGFYILAGLFAAVGVLLIEGHLLDLLYAFLVRLIGIPPKEKPARIHTGTASLHT
jgi:pheromone shutdown protein TraB